MENQQQEYADTDVNRLPVRFVQLWNWSVEQNINSFLKVRVHFLTGEQQRGKIYLITYDIVLRLSLTMSQHNYYISHVLFLHNTT